MSRETNRAARRSETRKAKNRKSGMAALSLLATTSLMSSYVSLLRTEPSFASANLASCDGVTELVLDVSGAASEDVGRIQDLQIALDAAIQDESGVPDRCVTVTFVSPFEEDTLNFTNTTGEGETRTVDTASLYLNKNDGPALDPRIFFIGNDVTFDFSFNDTGAFLSSPIYSELALEIHDISFVNSNIGGDSSEFAYGGVIHQAENDLSIFGSEFFDNSAYGNQRALGGAIFFGGDDLNVMNTEFRYNFSFNLTSEGDPPAPKISEGGAIYAASATSVTITDSVFESNGSYAYEGNVAGGAIFAGNGLIVQGSQFDTNFTFGYTSEGGFSITRGGAIKAGDYASISNTSFISNGSFGYENENIAPSTLTESMYGGAVNVAKFATITDSTFKFNSAAYSGGAIWAYSDLEISGSTFENNSADNYGGAIYLNYGAGEYSDNGSQISGSSFTSNTASSEGGALFVYNQYNQNYGESGIETTVSSSSFTDNSAGYQGGAIAANGYAYINTSTFVSNSSRGNGGAINLETDSIVSNSTFQENSARFEGGAIKGGFDNEILFNTFSNNLSDSDRRFSNNKREMGESFSSEGAYSIVGNIFAGDSRYRQLDVDFYSYGTQEYNLSTGDDFFSDEYTNRRNVSVSDLGLDSELRDNETNNFSQTLAIISSSSEAYGFVPFSSSEGWDGVEHWLGVPAADQRGVLRPTSGFVNAGAFEGFISRPAPSGSGGGSSPAASGGGSSPAAFSAVIIAGPSPKAGSVVKVSGVELKKVTEVYLGQTKVKISRASDSEIRFKLPKSVTGAVTIRFVGPGIEHIHVLNIDGSVRNEAVVPGFASNSTKLTRTMKKEIEAFIESNAGLTTVTCKGFTSAPATRQDLRLARERGQATCDYIKKLNPELTVKVLAGAHTNTPGKQVRRVRLEMN